MKITSDPNTTGDPTDVASSQVPLLPRGEDGKELNWRTEYVCTCPPGSETSDCPGCVGLMKLLERLRSDRRTRAVRTTSGATAKERRAASRDEGII